MINYTKLSIPFEKNNFNLTGYSRSGTRTGIYLEEYDIMMDAGLYFDRKPKMILVTHGHLDHVCNLYSSLLDNINKPIVLAPPSSVGFLKNYINSQHTVSLNRKSYFNKYKMTDGRARKGHMYATVGPSEGIFNSYQKIYL